MSENELETQITHKNKPYGIPLITAEEKPAALSKKQNKITEDSRFFHSTVKL